jgi:hypothetical protein
LVVTAVTSMFVTLSTGVALSFPSGEV